MPFLTTTTTSLRRALPAAILFITTIASAQQCYYPDGKTLAQDTPCDTTATASACCPSDSFCLSGGMCVSGGIISRGSCTDATWESAACAGYCKTVGPDASIAITPCSTDTDSNTFACGLAGDCSKDTFTLPADTSLALRPSQIAALVGTLAGSSNTAPSAPACPSTAGLVSVGALAGVACGVGLPLIIALVVMMMLLRREKRRFSKPKLMYKLPEDCKEEFTFRAPPPPRSHHPHSGIRVSTTDTASAYSSRRGSFRTAAASPGLSPRPMQGTFMERYESMRKSAGGQVHEMDSTPSYQEAVRHEMGDYRR